MSFAQLIEDHNLYTQRAHLALLAEQIVIEGLKEEIRALTIQSGASCLLPFSRSTRSPTTRSADALDLTRSLRAVQRNHKLVRFKHRESKADREFEALEERERLAVAKVRPVRFSHSRTTEPLRPDCLLITLLAIYLYIPAWKSPRE